MKKKRRTQQPAPRPRSSSWVMRHIEHCQMIHGYEICKRGWQVDKYSGGRICNSNWDSIGVDSAVWNANIEVNLIDQELDKVES